MKWDPVIFRTGIDIFLTEKNLHNSNYLPKLMGQNFELLILPETPADV